jgi:hypothetical protein
MTEAYTDLPTPRTTLAGDVPLTRLRWKCARCGHRTIDMVVTSRVASVQCQMTGADEGSVAQELGRVIGGALGKRVERQALPPRNWPPS